MERMVGAMKEFNGIKKVVVKRMTGDQNDRGIYLYQQGFLTPGDKNYSLLVRYKWQSPQQELVRPNMMERYMTEEFIEHEYEKNIFFISGAISVSV